MKKYFKYLLILMLFVATPVFAASNDLFRSDKNIEVHDELNGSGFIVGETVDVDGKINGILFTAGNNVIVESTSDYLFSAGNSVKVDGVLAKDGFVAGNIINIQSGNIERDLYIGGTAIDLNANVGRNAYIAGNTVKFDGRVMGNLNIDASEIIIGKNAVVEGKLSYAETAKITIEETAKIGTKEAIKTSSIKTESKIKVFTGKLYEMLFSFSNLFLVGVLMILFAPKAFEKISSMKKETILSNLGFGFVTLLFAPLAAIVLMFTMIGVSAGIILLVLYLMMLYLSIVFTSYYLSNMVLSNKIKNKFLLLLIGLLAIKILTLIPFIGTLVSVISLCLGLGIVVSLIFNRK